MARRRALASIPVSDGGLCCGSLTDAPLSEAEAVELAKVLAAISDPVRLRLLSIVAGNGEVCSCDLETPLARSQPTISHHTRILSEAGLITGEKARTVDVVADRSDSPECGALAPSAALNLLASSITSTNTDFKVRRERDSNPRCLAAQRFSRPPHSSALPSLQCCRSALPLDHSPEGGEPVAGGAVRGADLVESPRNCRT